jgi:hypothetical protein
MGMKRRGRGENVKCAIFSFILGSESWLAHISFLYVNGYQKDYRHSKDVL